MSTIIVFFMEENDMHRNKTLHSFLLSKAKQLTEEWYASLNKNDPTGVYSSTNPAIIENLKGQNFEFHLHLCEIFILEKDAFFKKFQPWIEKVAKDPEHQSTPIHFILREFMRTREQYFGFLEEFITLHPDVTADQLKTWERLITQTFDEAILRFAEETHNMASLKLEAQQEMINELSSPVISLKDHYTALLPLVGDIDTARAKMILEKTLEQCSKMRVTRLYIDLSGVIIIDTMVAHQLFQLIDALRLIGVETILSGIRAEIAQTAVQLGLSFDKVITKASLSQALTVE